MIMLKNGEIIMEGPPEESFTEENIIKVYGVNALVKIDDDGKPSIVPVRRNKIKPDLKISISG